MRKLFHLYNVDDEKVYSCTREISRDMLLNFDQSEVMGRLKADVVSEIIKSMLYQITAGKTYLVKMVDAETEDFMSNAKVYQATLGFMEVEEVKDNEPERREIECPYSKDEIKKLLATPPPIPEATEFMKAARIPTWLEEFCSEKCKHYNPRTETEMASCSNPPQALQVIEGTTVCPNWEAKK